MVHTVAMRVYVVADDAGREAGFVGAQLERGGADLIYLERMELPAFESLPTPGLLLLLGSHLSAHDSASADVVAAESRLCRTALDSDVPIMAICYGAQVLARALGGDSYRAAAPELGWHPVDTVDPVLCPPGPWPQLHKDVFVAPPTATVLGTSAFGHQCFTDVSRGTPAIAWQFHPEVTAAHFISWVEQDEDYYRAAGADTAKLRTQTRELEPMARAAAGRLTDAALAWLYQPARRTAAPRK